MGGSITRGNADEQENIPGVVATALVNLSQDLNPHHVYGDLINHGYSLLDITPDALIAEVWFSDKLEMTDIETLGTTLICLEGENHWQRGETVSVTSNSLAKQQVTLFPNPSTNEFQLELNAKQAQSIAIELLTVNGLSIYQTTKNVLAGKNRFTIPTHYMEKGYFFVKISGETFTIYRKWIKQ